MNLVAVQLLRSYLIPLLLGMSVVSYLFRKKPLSTAPMLALSWGIGLGLLTQYMFISLMIGLPLSVGSTAIFAIGLALVLFYLGIKKEGIKTMSPEPESSAYSYTGPRRAALAILAGLLIACILFQTFFVFWDSFHLPISYFDAFASIAMKAKILFYTNAFDHVKDVSHPSYPLQMPLALTWVSLNLGYFDEQLIKMLTPLTYLSFLCLQYFFLREWTSKLWSLFGVVLLISSSIFVHHASVCLRDFTMLYYNCSAIMMILVWHKRKDDAFLILASLLSGFATFTKLEGSAYWVIHLLLLGTLIFFFEKNNIKSRLRNLLIFFIPSFSICICYHLFKVSMGIPNAERLANEFSMGNLYLAPQIVWQVGRHLANYQDWNIVWFLCGLAALVSVPKQKSNAIKIILCALMLYFGMYFVLALTNAVNFESIAGGRAYDVLPRILLHFFPMATWLIVLVHGQQKM